MTTVLEGLRDQRHALAALYPGKDPVSIVQKAGWVQGPVWTGAENLAPTGIRSPDRPARSQSLYRLRYPAQLTVEGEYIEQHRIYLQNDSTMNREGHEGKR
jgi:hypothetical protein